MLHQRAVMLVFEKNSEEYGNDQGIYGKHQPDAVPVLAAIR
jgi:hypothetical protein